MGRRFAFRAWAWVLPLLVIPSVAMGAGGLERPVAGAVVLRFGAAFSEAGTQCTHRGVDIAAEPGETVRASADGVVTFAGGVPADGGGRTVAVTVTTPEGLLVCVMPLERSSVRTGDRVSVGDRLGELAGAGDSSSADPHVHLSVRSGGAYLDPELLLRDGVAMTESTRVTSGGGAEPTDGSAGSQPPQRRVQPNSGLEASHGRSAGVSSFVAPVLSSTQITAIRQAFSAQIARMRSGHGQLRASGFREPTLADTVQAAIPRPHVVMPVGSVGAALIGMVALGGMFVRKLHSGAEMARAGCREQ